MQPDCSTAYNDRGAVYADKGEFDVAIVEFSQAIQLTAMFALTYSDRGLPYSIKGDFDLAIADFSKAIQLTPDSVKTTELTLDIAFIYYKRGEMQFISAYIGYQPQSDLTTAQNIVVDINAQIHHTYKSVRQLWREIQVFSYQKTSQHWSHRNRFYTFSPKVAHCQIVCPFCLHCLPT